MNPLETIELLNQYNKRDYTHYQPRIPEGKQGMIHTSPHSEGSSLTKIIVDDYTNRYDDATEAHRAALADRFRGYKFPERYPESWYKSQALADAEHYLFNRAIDVPWFMTLGYNLKKRLGIGLDEMSSEPTVSQLLAGLGILPD